MPNKYVQYGEDLVYKKYKQRKKIHPIWRGIGFVLMFLIPAMSYLLTLVLIEENSLQHWVKIPREFLFHGGDSLLFVKIGVTLIITFVLYSLMTIVGVFILRSFGPSRYGPLDVPPE